MSDHAISAFPTSTTGCYCTGACKLPGGSCPATFSVTVQQGWRCPGCGNTWSPWVVQCPVCAPRRLAATPDCGCPPDVVCNNNVACPRCLPVPR